MYVFSGTTTHGQSKTYFFQIGVRITFLSRHHCIIKMWFIVCLFHVDIIKSERWWLLLNICLSLSDSSHSVDWVVLCIISMSTTVRRNRRVFIWNGDLKSEAVLRFLKNGNRLWQLLRWTNCFLWMTEFIAKWKVTLFYIIWKKLKVGRRLFCSNLISV